MFTASSNSTYQELFGGQRADETRDTQCFEYMPRMHSFDFDSELDSNRYVYFDMKALFKNESPVNAALSSLLNSTQQGNDGSKLDESCSSSSTTTITHTLAANQDDLDQVGEDNLCIESSSPSTSSSEMNSSASPSSSSSSTSLSMGVTGNSTNSSLYLLKKSLANKLSLPASASSSSECLSSCCNYGDDEGYVGSLTDSSSASSSARGAPPPQLPTLAAIEAARVKDSITSESFLFSRYFMDEKNDPESSSNQMTEEKSNTLLSSPPIVYSNSDEDLTGYEEDETNSEDEEENENPEVVEFTIPCLFQETEGGEEWRTRLNDEEVTTKEPESFDERLWFYWSSSCLDDQIDYYSANGEEKSCVDCCGESCELCELEQIRRELEEQRESDRLETEDAMRKRDEWRRVVERLQRELATRREYAHEDSIDMNAYLNEIEMNIDYLQQMDLDYVDDLLRFASNRNAFNLRSYHNYLMSLNVKTKNQHVTSGSSIREMFEKMDKIPEFVPPSTSSRQQTVLDDGVAHDQELAIDQDFFLDYEANQHETTLYLDDQNCDDLDPNLNDNNATLVEANNYDEENNLEDEEYQYYLNEAGGEFFVVDGVYDEELEDQFYIDSLTEEEALSLLRNESELYAMHMAQAAKLGLLPNTGGGKGSKSSKKNKSGKQKNKVAASSVTVQTAKSVTEPSTTDSAVPAAKKSKKSKKSKKQKKTGEEEQTQQEQENTVPSTATESLQLPDKPDETTEQSTTEAKDPSGSNEQDIFETVFAVYDQDNKTDCCDDEDTQSQQRSHQASECDYYEEIGSEFGGYNKTESSVSSMTISNTMRESLLQLRMSRRHLSRLIEANNSPSPTKSSSPSGTGTTSSKKGATTPLITIKQRSSTAACFNKPCMYMLTDGKCARSDCRYVHDFKTITCKYWQEGECLKGETCEFLHEHVDGTSGKSATIAGGVAAFSFGSVCSSSTASSSGASSSSKKAKKKKKAAAAAAAAGASVLNRDDFNLDSEEFPALGGFSSAFPALTSTVTEKPPVQSVKSLQKSEASSKSTPLSQVVKSQTASKAVNIANKSSVVAKSGSGEKSSSSLTPSFKTLLSSSLSSSNTTTSTTNKPSSSGKSTPVKK